VGFWSGRSSQRIFPNGHFGGWWEWAFLMFWLNFWVTARPFAFLIVGETYLSKTAVLLSGETIVIPNWSP
jgi:hypothetical protein